MLAFSLLESLDVLHLLLIQSINLYCSLVTYFEFLLLKRRFSDVCTSLVIRLRLATGWLPYLALRLRRCHSPSEPDSAWIANLLGLDSEGWMEGGTVWEESWPCIRRMFHHGSACRKKVLSSYLRCSNHVYYSMSMGRGSVKASCSELQPQAQVLV